MGRALEFIQEVGAQRVAHFLGLLLPCGLQCGHALFGDGAQRVLCGLNGGVHLRAAVHPLAQRQAVARADVPRLAAEDFSQFGGALHHRLFLALVPHHQRCSQLENEILFLDGQHTLAFEFGFAVHLHQLDLFASAHAHDDVHVRRQQRVHERLVFGLRFVPAWRLRVASVRDVLASADALPLVRNAVDHEDFHAGFLEFHDGVFVALGAERRVQVANQELVNLALGVHQAVRVERAPAVFRVEQSHLLGVAFRKAPGELQRGECLPAATDATQADDKARAFALGFADIDDAHFEMLSDSRLQKKTGSPNGHYRAIGRQPLAELIARQLGAIQERQHQNAVRNQADSQKPRCHHAAFASCHAGRLMVWILSP
ncbi:hypothetical protein D3C72_1249200 [compost metagenome]